MIKAYHGFDKLVISKFHICFSSILDPELFFEDKAGLRTSLLDEALQNLLIVPDLDRATLHRKTFQPKVSNWNIENSLSLLC